jgi:hypothetical protein
MTIRAGGMMISFQKLCAPWMKGKRPWNDPFYVSYTPIATTCLLETANLGQIVRMWTFHTAAGQSLTSWCCVNLALWLWANWYRVITPQQKIARFTIKVGITLNTCVILTAIYFRYAVDRG